jgi:hypothetical protein
MGVMKMPGEVRLPRWIKPANRVIITLQRLGLAIGTMRLAALRGLVFRIERMS